MTDLQHNNVEEPYIYHTPSSTYHYPNEPYEPFPQRKIQPPKRKHNFKIIAGIICSLAITTLSLFLAYHYIPSVQRFFIRNLHGADKYYLHIESKNLEKTLASMGDIIEESNELSLYQVNKSASTKATIDLQINENTLLGLDKPIEYGLTYLNEQMEGASRTSLSLQNGESNLFSFDYLQDMKHQYLQFPELDDRYIDITELINLYTSFPDNFNISDESTTSSLKGTYQNSQELFLNFLSTINEDMLLELMNRYGNSLVEGISKYSSITVTEGTSINLNDYLTNTLSDDTSLLLECDQFTITLTEKDAITILQNLLTLLKTDNDFLQLAKVFGVDHFYYNIAITYISAELQSYPADEKNTFLTMTVYAHQDDIILRKIKFVTNNTPYELILSSYKDEDYRFLYTSLGEKTNNETYFSLCLSYDVKEQGADGVGYGSILGSKFQMKLSGLCKKNSRYSILPTGTLSVTVEDGEGVHPYNTQITYQGELMDSKQTATISVEYDQINLLNLHGVFEPYTSSGFHLPQNPGDIVSGADKAQVKQYLEDSSLETVLDNLSKHFPLALDKKTAIDSILAFLDDNVYTIWLNKGEYHEKMDSQANIE